MTASDQAADRPLLLVVGAGPGIGTSTARRFGQDGYRVALIARRQEPLRAAAQELTAEGVPTTWATASVDDAPALASAVRQLAGERADVLLFNAVAFRAVRADELTADDLLADLAVGAAALQTCVQAVLPAMRAAGAGVILATGGGTADRPMPLAASLGVQKAALRTLVRTLAANVHEDGVRVATLTIRGIVREGTPFAPEVVADAYATLAARAAGGGPWWPVLELTGEGMTPDPAVPPLGTD